MRPEFASVSVRFVLVCRVRRFGVWGLRLPRGLDSGHTGALIESPGSALDTTPQTHCSLGCRLTMEPCREPFQAESGV